MKTRIYFEDGNNAFLPTVVTEKLLKSACANCESFCTDILFDINSLTDNVNVLAGKPVGTVFMTVVGIRTCGCDGLNFVNERFPSDYITGFIFVAIREPYSCAKLFLTEVDSVTLCKFARKLVELKSNIGK